MELVAALLVVGLVVAIAAVFVVREAGRIARTPPPALFDTADAYEWVVEHVPDDVAATLTAGDVRRILDFQVEFFERKGVSPNGSTPYAGGPVVVGGAEPVAYIVERSADDRRGVPPRAGATRWSRPSSSYLRAIGADRPARPTAAEDDGPAKSTPRGDRARATSSGHQGKEVVHTCMINTGPWRCAAARPTSPAGPPGGVPPPHRHRHRRGLVPPANTVRRFYSRDAVGGALRRPARSRPSPRPRA